MSDQQSKPPKKKLHELPHETKRQIIIITVSICTIGLLAVWSQFFFGMINQNSEDYTKPIINTEQWGDTKSEFDQILREGKDEINQVIKQAEEKDATITPQNLSDQDLETIKNKLLELNQE